MSNEAQVAVVSATAYGYEAFMQGYTASIKGADLADMTTEDERAGWWYARRPAGENGPALEDDDDDSVPWLFGSIDLDAVVLGELPF